MEKMTISLWDILCIWLTMRRSPRRPLILKRGKLLYHQNNTPTSQDASVPQENPQLSSASQQFPDSVRVLDHPFLPGTQVVVIPKTAELRSVIEALTAKGKECGAQGPNKFILLGESGSLDSGSLRRTDEDAVFAGSTAGQQVSHSAEFTGIKQVKKEDDGCFNENLTSMQWLQSCNALQPGPGNDMSNEETQTAAAVLEGRPCEAACGSLAKTTAAPLDVPKDATSAKPPFSYMTMLQFAINSSKDGHMTLKQIYEWLQHHFDFFRDEKRRGWKNSVRHNLSMHKMFLRKMTSDRKVSFWTIRPEANRGLTLDQVYTPGCNPVAAPFARPVPSTPCQQTLPVAKKSPIGSAKQMKPLLPRPLSNLVPFQCPLSASVCLSSSASVGPPAPAHHTASSPRKAKRRRSAPKDGALLQDEALRAKVSKVELKEERVCRSVPRRSPKALARRQQAGGSRRKQHLACSHHEEPLLVYSQNSDGDSGIATSSTWLDAEPDLHSYKTPIKAGRRLASSTPSKPAAAESGSQSVLDFSPIRTPSGPARTPLHDYTTFSMGGTPFKDWALFSDATSTSPGWPSACSGEMPLAGGGGTPPTNRSLTEGLVLDTMNDSLSKILVDLSFGLDDVHDLDLADISLSEIIPQLT
ncbi:forkhead box protein M1 isoform X4 [Festucalex cinctus]